MVRSSALLAVASLLASSFVVAHPGEDETQSAAQIARRAEYHADTARSLSACTNSPHYLAMREQAIKRRSEFLAHLNRRAARRSVSTSLNTNHKSSLTGLTATTNPSVLFGTTPQCLMEPAVTEGPYFVAGEFIRSNITDGQAGLPLYLDIQFVDAATCLPIPSLYVNFWHCNTTGVYSGVVANGNGNSADTSNYLKTNHRGIYPTDSTGVVQFTTTFPGHYTGRATHIHIATAYGGTVQANNTYTGAKYSHVGQLFFDQSLITAVEALSPYSSNTQTLTTNANDGIFSTSAATSFDPVVSYAYINDNINNGILGWISIAVDTTKSISVSAAYTYTGNGLVSSSPSPTASSGASTPSPSPSTGSVAASATPTVSPTPSASKSVSATASPSTSRSPSSSPSSSRSPSSSPSSSRSPSASPSSTRSPSSTPSPTRSPSRRG